jgi:hypothetical protein
MIGLTEWMPGNSGKMLEIVIFIAGSVYIVAHGLVPIERAVPGGYRFFAVDPELLALRSGGKRIYKDYEHYV